MFSGLFLLLEVQLPTPIEVEQCLLVEVLVACLHQVALCFQVVVLRLIELSNGGLAILVFAPA